ncbi:MAG: VOC family protein [Gammaproteobacteria bacterium AqS3]|nr:VOC family protein [Gammaproteobacteria bacterium AqS3]
MSKINGVHHIAIATANMKEQLEFFSDVLGMRLLGLYWMHGVKGAWHAFMEMGDESFAFAYVPGNEKVDIEYGVTHAGSGAGVSAPGSMQHIAFNVDTPDDLMAMRDRIRSRGVNVFGPIQHGLCQSIYFAGPEGLTLEVATSGEAGAPLDHEGTWIDREVQELAGISDAELEQLMNPSPYAGEGGQVGQPAYDPAKPHNHYPEKIYQRMLATPDEDMIAGSAQWADPPENSAAKPR